MKKLNWLGAAAFAILASGAPAVVSAEAYAGPGDASKNLTTVTDGFELADDNSTAAANSVAQFDLTAGTLALKAVPNLHFSAKSVRELIGGAQTFSTDNAAVTNAAAGFDGNNAMTISVADFRGNNAGWHLAAKLGTFAGNKTITADSLTLASGAITGDNATGLTLANTNFANQDATLLSAATNSGSGDTTVNVASGSLTLPQDPTALAGTYQAAINWTLAAVPDAN